jgi:putative transcriptional regulator
MAFYMAALRQAILPSKRMPLSKRSAPALVKELRKRLHLTQEQFAQRIGVTYSTVNHWENGKRVPQPFLLRRLQEMKEELDSLGKKQSGARAES